MTALEQWARDLGSWAIPPDILAAAPQSPWGFDVGLFARIAEAVQTADTPSRRGALDALPHGGTVLDVGCGAGAASLALVPIVGHAVGVDSTPAMLDAFAERADTLGVGHEEIAGTWPGVAAAAPVCDVVTCHHVVYNVADIAPFLQALTAHARQRVVVEMTAEHPLTWMNPLWQRLHGVERPTQPTAATLLDVLAELGIDARSQAWTGARGPSAHLDVPAIRRRLCLPADRDDELAAALADLPSRADRHFVSIWWDGAA